MFNMLNILFSFFFVSQTYIFFFQAEDGIRDIGVTGVQTCALPICEEAGLGDQVVHVMADACHLPIRTSSIEKLGRSEERRVGKECRLRWTTYHKKKKNKTFKMCLQIN